jgi:hypothetical protein
MDPIGTVRREDHKEGEGQSIWIRQDPGYPDSEMTDTEWTCIWSTAVGNIGYRLGDRIAQVSQIIGAVPGTPAQTAADVELHDRVETLPGALYWTDEPVRGIIVAIIGRPHAHCTILFDEPQAATNPPHQDTTYTHWGVSRLSFRLLEEDFA